MIYLQSANTLLVPVRITFANASFQKVMLEWLKNKITLKNHMCTADGRQTECKWSMNHGIISRKNVPDSRTTGSFSQTKIQKNTRHI
jgi:hypothetical protein